MKIFPTIENYQNPLSHSEVKGSSLSEKSPMSGFKSLLEQYSSIKEARDVGQAVSSATELNGQDRDTDTAVERVSLKEAMSSSTRFSRDDNPFTRYSEWRNSVSQTGTDGHEKDDSLSVQKQETTLKQALSGANEYSRFDNPFERYAEWLRNTTG